MLPTPSYIDLKVLQNQPDDFAWDDGLPHSVLTSLDTKTVKNLRKVSDHAKIGFVIACSEWVVYRFQKKTSIDWAWEYIEASWARLVNPILARPWEPEEWKWVGRVDGSVATSLHSITNTFYGVDEGGGWMEEISLSSSFTEHVLDKFSGFVRWRSIVIPHLIKNFPYVVDQPLGKPLHRIALDPLKEISSNQFDQLVKLFFRTLDPKKNRFLTTPEEQAEIRASEDEA